MIRSVATYIFTTEWIWKRTVHIQKHPYIHADIHYTEHLLRGHSPADLAHIRQRREAWPALLVGRTENLENLSYLVHLPCHTRVIKIETQTVIFDT